jgi:hypothetical protein
METSIDTQSSLPEGSRNKTMFEFGILIPILTVIAFASIYYFELGYFDYFRIPADYIEVELTKSSYTIFILFTLVCLLLWIRVLIVTLYQQIKILIEKKNWKSPDWDAVKGLLIFLLLTSFIIYLYRETFEINNNNALSLVYLVLSVVIGVFLSKAKPEELKSVTSAIDRHMVNFIGMVLVICSLSCLLMFFSGRFFAKTSARPSVSGHQENTTVLLRRYSGYSIYGVRDSTHSRDTTKKWFETFIISRGKDDVDTIKGTGLTPYDN